MRGQSRPQAIGTLGTALLKRQMALGTALRTRQMTLGTALSDADSRSPA
jgi:hypothetical protein